MDWVASHPHLKQLDKKCTEIYVKNMRKYVGPKEIEKSTGDLVFPPHNLLRKREHLIRSMRLFLKSSPLSLKKKKYQIEHLPISCLNDSETQERRL